MTSRPQATQKTIESVFGEIFICLVVGAGAGAGVLYLLIGADKWLTHLHLASFVLISWLDIGTPSQAVVGAKYLSALASYNESLKYSGIFLAAIIASLVAGISLFIYISKKSKVSNEKHIRGYRYLGDISEATKEIKRKAKRAAWRLGKGLQIHHSFSLPFKILRKGGILLLGMPGAGKTQFLFFVIANILKSSPDAKNIIFDPTKGDFTSKFPRSFTLIAPWDKRGTPWAICRDVRTKSDARLIGVLLVAEGKDPMWHNAARAICAGLLTYLTDTRPGNWSFKDFADLLKISDAELGEILQKYSPESIRVIKNLENEGRTSEGIMINVDSYMGPIHDLAGAWGDKKDGFSAREFLDDNYTGKKDVIIQGSSLHGPLAKSLTGALMSMAIIKIIDPSFPESDKRHINLFFDELARVEKLDLLGDLTATSRSKGVTNWIGFQTINQFRDIYGDRQADSIISMMGTRFVGALGGGETADAVCHLFGEREVSRLVDTASGGRGQASPSSSMTWQTQKEDVLLPAQLAYEIGIDKKGFKAILQVIEKGFDGIYRLAWPFTSLPDLREGVIQAQWSIAKEMEKKEEKKKNGTVLEMAKENEFGEFEVEVVEDEIIEEVTEEEETAFLPPAPKEASPESEVDEPDETEVAGDMLKESAGEVIDTITTAIDGGSIALAAEAIEIITEASEDDGEGDTQPKAAQAPVKKKRKFKRRKKRKNIGEKEC